MNSGSQIIPVLESDLLHLTSCLFFQSKFNFNSIFNGLFVAEVMDQNKEELKERKKPTPQCWGMSMNQALSSSTWASC